MYCELHVTSNFSFLRDGSHLEEVIEEAKLSEIDGAHRNCRTL